MPTTSTISFSKGGDDRFEREFLSSRAGEPIELWLKSMSSKKSNDSSDPILTTLLVELHKKVDALERLLNNQKEQRELLEFNDVKIDLIGFEHFKLKESLLVANESYFARANLPVFPKREIILFFEALDDKLAKVTKIAEVDERDWSMHITAIERSMIRTQKEQIK